jgi:predicted MPP superfamily phosphohydrolase
VFVTSGVGTSILPLRYGAQSQWDMLELSWLKK